MLRNKKLLTLALLAVALVACKTTSYTLTNYSSTAIAIDASTDRLANADYLAYLEPIKQNVDAQMNVVIGQVAVDMRAHKPESLLSNFSADAYLATARKYSTEPVHIAVVNLGGLRTQVPKGDFTMRKAFELMPFENELVLLWLKGSDVLELLDGFAAVGGQGVAGLSMTIKDAKAQNILIGGKALDLEATYCICTNDYLAKGNDNMPALTKNIKREDTSIKVRDLLINYVKAETAAGRAIEPKLDGRIVVAP